MNNYIAAGLVALAFASNALGKEAGETCNGTEISDVCFSFENASVERAYDAGSEKVFAVVYELHKSQTMQENVFYTIEELIEENNAGFLAMEYFQGEFSFDSDACRFQSYPRLFSNTLSIFASIGCQPELQRRNDALYYARAGSPLCAASLLELIYGDNLLTFGMDDWELRQRAHAVGSAARTNADIAIYEDIINRQRSIAFLQHIEDYLSSHEASKVIIVSTGLNHRESLEAELERKGYSYVSILPFGRRIEEE